MKTITTFFLITLFLIYSNTSFSNSITDVQTHKAGIASETEVPNYRNYAVIDDFDDDVDMWWQPDYSGSTMGIILGDDDGNPLTYKAHETTIVNPYTGSTGSMKLAFVWDDDIEWVEPAPNGTHSHFIRVFFPVVYAMEPERRFEPGQALEVFIYGDGSGNRMRLMVRDGISQLEGSPWQIIDWTGWQKFTWNYNDVANVFGWVNGDGEMTEGEPFFFDSFQFTRNEQGTTTEGVFYMDDLRIIDLFSVTFNIVDADGTEVITINDTQYDAGITDFQLFSGTYQFTVSKTGYQTYLGSFVLDDEDLTIEVELNPAEDGQMPGDANCDGLVNVLDVIAMVNHFIGLAPDPFCFENADVNGDGVINILDVVATVNIFINDNGDQYDTVTDIDGNVYSTLIIGDQEWMAEKLRVIRYNNGDDILTGLNNAEWSNTTNGAYAVVPHSIIDGLDSDAEVVSAYGKLYNWYAVADVRGICPEGWNVPSDDDWTQLVDYVVSQGFPNDSDDPDGAGNALKSCRQIDSPIDGCDTSEHPRWQSQDMKYGFDEFSFSALPGGCRSAENGTFYDIGFFATWWSFSSDGNSNAWSRTMHGNSDTVNRTSYNKRFGYSVRCVRNTDK